MSLSTVQALFSEAYHRWSVSDVHLSADGRILGTAYVAGSVWSSSYKSYRAL